MPYISDCIYGSANFAEHMGEKVMFLGKLGIFAAFFAMLAGSASAVPMAISQAAFSGGETVIDFNSVPDTVSVTNQYSGQGVTFSGALVGLTEPGDTTLFNGSTIASNWIYGGGGNTGASWSAVFGAVQNLVGFFVETNVGDDVTIEAFLGATSLGSVNFPNPNGLTVDFIGIQDMSGFDRVTVTTAGSGNGFFAMDDFRFEGTGQVPAPSILPLLCIGLAGMGFLSRRIKV